MKVNTFSSMQGANALSNIGGSLKKNIQKLAGSIKSFSFSSPSKTKQQLSTSTSQTTTGAAQRQSQPVRTKEQQQQLFKKMEGGLNDDEISQLKGTRHEAMGAILSLMKQGFSEDEALSFRSHLIAENTSTTTAVPQARTESQVQATKDAIGQGLASVANSGSRPGVKGQFTLQGESYVVAKTNSGAVLQNASDYEQGIRSGFFQSNDGTVVNDGGDEFKNLSYNEFVRNFTTG